VVINLADDSDTSVDGAREGIRKVVKSRLVGSKKKGPHQYVAITKFPHFYSTAKSREPVATHSKTVVSRHRNDPRDQNHSRMRDRLREEREREQKRRGRPDL